MIPRTVAIYLRVSTEDQAREGFSLGNQEESNRAYIRQKFGVVAEVVIYQDIESGYSIERKNYLRLLEDCRQRKVDALVVWRLDRFTRNTSAGLAALSDLTVKLGIPVFSVMEGQIDFNDPNNKLMNTFLVGMAEFERNRIQQRVMPGMKQGAKLGHYQGTRYVILGAAYNKPMQRLEWIPNEVKMLKILFKRVAEGDSLRSMARHLHLAGYRNRRGKALGTSLLAHAIKREIYCDGYYRWNGITSEKPVLEPIIDRSTWERANQVVSTNRSPQLVGRRGGAHRDDSPYILHGVLKCRLCGGNLVGHTQRLGVRYYGCSTYFSKGKVVCEGQWIKADSIETQARHILKTAISNKQVLALAREELGRMIADRNPEILAGIRLAERQLRELTEQHRRLLELRYKDAVSVDQFKDENTRLLEQQQIVKLGLDQLQQQRERTKRQNASLDRTFQILENFDTVFESLAPKGKKELYRSVIQFAHAKSLGPWKGVYIENYELTGPFQQLLMGEVNNEDRNVSKNLCEYSSIQSLPMAGHTSSMCKFLSDEGRNLSTLEGVLQRLSTTAEKAHQQSR